MEKKTFAFKLADKNVSKNSKWRAREGVSVAGCTDYLFPDNLRYSVGSGRDNGAYC